MQAGEVVAGVRGAHDDLGALGAALGEKYHLPWAHPPSFLPSCLRLYQWGWGR